MIVAEAMQKINDRIFVSDDMRRLVAQSQRFRTCGSRNDHGDIHRSQQCARIKITYYFGHMIFLSQNVSNDTFCLSSLYCNHIRYGHKMTASHVFPWRADESFLFAYNAQI